MMGMLFLWPLLLGFLVVVFLVAVVLAGGTAALQRLLGGVSLEGGDPSGGARGNAPAEDDAGPVWPEPNRLCPACNAPFERGWRACQHCGQPLV